MTETSLPAPSELIDQYAQAGPLLAASVAGLSTAQLAAHPVPGTQSVHWVICHVVDFDQEFAQRMKRVIAEQDPPVIGGDENLWAANLCYAARNTLDEVNLSLAIRRQMLAILRQLPPEAFQRRGIHNELGPVTLHQLLDKAVFHCRHHLKFIDAKRVALGAAPLELVG